MPKQKSNKGLRKRLKVTATGKIKHRQPGHSHLMSGKSAKRRRRLRGSSVITGAAAKRLRIRL